VTRQDCGAEGQAASAAELRRLLLLVSAIVLVDTMFFTAVTPLLPHYVSELHLSRAGVGVLAATYATGVFVAALPSGVLASRLGVKPTVLIGLSGMAVTSLAFGLGRTVVVLDVARFVQGLAAACSWSGSLAWLVGEAPLERRGQLIGSALGAAIAGALLGPVLGGLASVVGTGPGFATVALLGIALGAWAIRLPAPARADSQPLSVLVGAIRDPRIMAGAWFVALPGMMFGVLGVLVPLRLADLGFKPVLIGATFLAAAGFEAGLSPLYGRLSDRLGRVPPVRLALVGSIVVTLILPWLDGAWLLAAGVVVAGAVFGGFWAPGFSMMADGADAQGVHHGFAFALMNLAWGPAQAAGAAGGGALAGATGDGGPYLLLAGLCVVTLAVIHRHPPSG
jgi:MFS family permease